MPLPQIPESITVHLGTPDSNAQNVTVPFPEYIKNVASGEIYPTWPEEAIRANIYAQITFALNRVFTEFYRSRGYDFDITSNTMYDQYYSPDREIFENISLIVDDIFNSYVQKQGTVGPYFTQYCDGRRVTCGGLSQWGTVALANQGYNPYEILQYYYGDDIDIVRNVAVTPNVPSYPGTAFRRGDFGEEVRRIQLRLNRISTNYPSIPKIYPVDGVYGIATEDAVREFQRIFNLDADGVVGKATWYRIIYIYNAEKRLSELDSEGISVSESTQQFTNVLRRGDSGNDVRVIQYYLAAVGNYYPTVPVIPVTGNFGKQTENAVKAFQTLSGLNPDGIVGRQTWNALYDAYLGIVASGTLTAGGTPLFGGTVLRVGSSGEQVTLVQQFLNTISTVYNEITPPSVTGYYGTQTEAAVTQFQNLFGLTPTGTVGALTWDTMASEYSDITVGSNRNEGQFSGYTLTSE